MCIAGLQKQGHVSTVKGINTVKLLKIRTPKNCCKYSRNLTMWYHHRTMHPKDRDGMANRVDPDQTAPKSDLGLHCLSRTVCLKI